ncbi:MAG: diguanylate cyclase [Povalibacter sp.]
MRLLPLSMSLLLWQTSSHAATATNPAQALIQRADLAVRTDPEASRRMAEQAIETLKRKPDADLEIRARLILCDYQSERDTSAAEQQTALIDTLLPQARRVGLRAGMLTCKGQIAETVGNNQQAKGLYEEAVNVATSTHDEEMLAGALFARGYLLGLEAKYAAGLADLKRSQTLYDQLHLTQHALTSVNGIAILYNRMGDFEEARHMYSQALKAQHAAGLVREEAVTLHNLGRANENLKDWEAARKAFQESLQLNRQINYSRGEAYALRGLAAVENGTGNPRAALDILQRAETLQRETPDARLLAQINLARGIALHQLKQLPQSIAALEDALQVFRQAASLSELHQTYVELAAAHADTGNWRAGYGFLDKAGETAERQFRNQVDQRFATLKIEFDTAAKEKENALLTRENEANEKALAQQARAGKLQALVITLIVVLALVLLFLALHHRRTSMRMRLLAMTDELTGVPNRRAVLGILEPLLEKADKSPCSVLIIDIDHFKSINDQHGHAEGDEALKLVSAKLRDTISDTGFVGRMGGEEFIAILPDLTCELAVEIAERVRIQIMSIDSLHWLVERRITVSIGVSTADRSSESSGTMLQRADAALYEAKRGGRNCVRVTFPSPQPAAPKPGSNGEVASGSVEYA